ncbi:DUF192 domain-containing protein [Lichenicoccus sp.]|uniref:DUF192 domain-containing protein n=1 Tax=Lichenicoccus sp. TaxID=2781899 RepID=UPI003D0D8EFA
MRRARLFTLVLVGAPILSGTVSGITSTRSHAQASRARDTSQTGEPTQAQPELQKQPLTIISRGGVRHDFSLELARTPREQQVGLMFRTVIPDTGGMLFIWPAPQDSAMWMENCPVPEDMVFVNADGTIRTIVENTVPQSLAQISSGGPVLATVELQGGITARLGVRVGDRIESKAFSQAARS